MKEKTFEWLRKNVGSWKCDLWDESGDIELPLMAFERLLEENERLRKWQDGVLRTNDWIKDAERWRTHGPLLIQLIEELVDEADDFGTIGEGAKRRVKSFIDEAMK